MIQLHYAKFVERKLTSKLENADGFSSFYQGRTSTKSD